MARDSIAGLFKVNRSITSIGRETRHFQMPESNPFPRLDQRVPRPVDREMLAAGSLPEMVSDLIDESTVYAVENVRRDSSGRHESRP